MPNVAFNVWPQYQAGWRRMYAPGAAGGPMQVAGAPYVGQPIGADTPPSEVYVPGSVAGPDTPPSEVYNPGTSGPLLTTTAYDPEAYRRMIAQAIPNLGGQRVVPTPTPEYVGISPDQFQGGGGGGSQGTTGGWDVAPTYPTIAEDPRKTAANLPAQPQATVRRAKLVALPGDIVGPDTPPSQVYTPTQPVGTGDVPGPDTPPAEVAAQTAAYGPQTGTIPYLASYGAVAPSQPRVAAAAARPAAAPAVTAIPQMRRALPVNYSYPMTQQPGLMQRLMQTLSHFFGGTLGQHGGQPYQAPAVASSGGNPANWGANVAQGAQGAFTGPQQGESVAAWMAARKAQQQAAKAQRGTGRSGSTPGKTPFVGQPLGGYGGYGQQQDPQQPVSSASELGNQPGAQDTSALAASGGGEPQSRYRMGPFNTGLTKIGGFTGQGGTAGSGLSPIESLLGGITGQMGKQGGQGGGGSIDNLGTLGDESLANEAINSGGGGLGGGMSGATGLSGAQLGSDVAGMFTALGKLYQQANAPVSVDPAAWANPPPGGATFTAPQLSANTGGVWYT